ILVSQPLLRGQTNYIFVRVTNLGPAVTRDVSVALRAVSYAGTEFVYPQDWKNIDATHIEPTAISTTVSGIPVGGTAIVKFSLSPAQVETLVSWESGGAHPCLLAEAACCNDFGSPVGVHVWENNNLAQRNVTIVTAKADTWVVFPFLV